jgi:NADH:ubiquinone oxidoreductase subunit C
MNLLLSSFFPSLWRRRFFGFNSSVGRAQGWKPWGRWFESSLKHLQRNLKLYFQYILFGVSHLYLDHSARDQKDVLVVVPKNVLYFTVLHIRLSSLFSTSQLVDIFAYELPVLLDSKIQTLTSSNAILVYNFHNLTFHERFFFFCVDFITPSSYASINSIRELYPNAWWLEREVSELHGYCFSNKKDLRNLMLQYGDTSAPFRKAYPSLGTREFFYDTVNDQLVQRTVTTQL